MRTAYRKALITGAAGGIGLEIAKLLDQKGLALILVDLHEERLKEAAAQLGAPVELMPCNLSDRDDVERLINQVSEKHPDLDVLVNNAGVIVPGAVSDITQEAIDAHLEVNLRAPIRLMRALAPLMIARKTGALVSTVSLGGIVALKESAAYSASKFGLRGFLCSLHQELHPLGVSVSGIYPAAVDTPMLHHEATTKGGSVLNFVDRVMTPRDIAEATWRAIQTGKLEIYAPYSASLSSRLAGAFPWMLRPLLPLLEKIGTAGRDKFVARKGLTPQP
ncbi:MAG: SDR family NAD(P)-dependent oxidoreductase [Rhizobiales bacterium]|nr:SDR family NAD(P)-dependent oxidoreductase [Hyphomicrobiales bacterium]